MQSIPIKSLKSMKNKAKQIKRYKNQLNSPVKPMQMPVKHHDAMNEKTEHKKNKSLKERYEKND